MPISGVSFVLVGGLAAGSGAAIYAGLVMLGWHFVAASLTSFAATVPLGYALNRAFTFRSAERVSRSFPRVAAIYIAQQVIMLVGIGLLVDFGLGPVVAYAAVLPFAVVFSYFAMKHFGFR
jgi:putative flippase GtrA